MRNIRLAYVYSTKRAGDEYDDVFEFWSLNRDQKPLWADAVFVAEAADRGIGIRLKCEHGSAEAAREAGYLIGWDITQAGRDVFFSHVAKVRKLLSRR